MLCNVLHPEAYLDRSFLPSKRGDNSPAVKLVNWTETLAIVYNLELKN